MKLLKAWPQHAGIATGIIFRCLGSRAIHPQKVARTWRQISRAMNEFRTRLGPSLRLGAHSTRIGAAHDMVAVGMEGADTI